MQYFADRFFTGRMLVNADDFLFVQLSGRYPGAMACAERRASRTPSEGADQRGGRLPGPASSGSAKA
ncbi:MAG: hypothetical protein R2719_15240 [Micropruina sp.]